MQDTVESLFQDINTLASQIAKELPKGAANEKQPDGTSKTIETETSWPPVEWLENHRDKHHFVEWASDAIVGESYLLRWYHILKRLNSPEIHEFINQNLDAFGFPESTFKYIGRIQDLSYTPGLNERCAFKKIIQALLRLVLKVTPLATPPPTAPEGPTIPKNWKPRQSLADIAFDLCITADAVKYHLKKDGLWSNNIRQNATGTWYTSPGFKKNCKIQEKKTGKREKKRPSKKGE
jgi:hypothetical protein